MTTEPILSYTNQAARLDMERWSSWLKAPVLKTGEDSRPPWVQIPLSPPQERRLVLQLSLLKMDLHTEKYSSGEEDGLLNR